MYRTILVDDEPDAIKTLEWEINTHCPELQIIGKYNDAVKALDALQLDTPDILFLDIKMPRLNGFDLLDKLETINFDVIFVTAYDEYAVKAFRINAVDYLLKPIITSDLLEAIKRVKVKNQLQDKSENIRSFQIEKLKRSFNKIPLSNTDGIEFVFPMRFFFANQKEVIPMLFWKTKKF